MRKRINRNLLIVFFITVILSLFSEKYYPQQIPLADKQTNKVKKEKLLTQDLKELNKSKIFRVKTRARYSDGYSEDGKLLGMRTLMEKIYFDEKGNRYNHEYYKRGTIIENSYKYEFDKNNNVTKQEVYNEYDFIIYRRESIYDNMGNEVERIYNEAKTRGQNRALFKYDLFNNLTEVITFDPNGNIKSTVELIYENGLLKKYFTKDSKDKIVEESKVDYDSNGNIIAESVSNAADTVTFTFKYNADDFVTEIKYLDSIRYIDYDESGNIIEDKKFFLNGEREYKVRFIYDDRGLLKEEIRYAANDSPNFYTEFVYEFYD